MTSPGTTVQAAPIRVRVAVCRPRSKALFAVPITIWTVIPAQEGTARNPNDNLQGVGHYGHQLWLRGSSSWIKLPVGSDSDTAIRTLNIRSKDSDWWTPVYAGENNPGYRFSTDFGRTSTIKESLDVYAPGRWWTNFVYTAQGVPLGRHRQNPNYNEAFSSLSSLWQPRNDDYLRLSMMMKRRDPRWRVVDLLSRRPSRPPVTQMNDNFAYTFGISPVGAALLYHNPPAAQWWRSTSRPAPFRHPDAGLDPSADYRILFGSNDAAEAPYYNFDEFTWDPYIGPGGSYVGHPISYNYSVTRSSFPLDFDEPHPHTSQLVGGLDFDAIRAQLTQKWPESVYWQGRYDALPGQTLKRVMVEGTIGYMFYLEAQNAGRPIDIRGQNVSEFRPLLDQVVWSVYAVTNSPWTPTGRAADYNVYYPATLVHPNVNARLIESQVGCPQDKISLGRDVYGVLFERPFRMNVDGRLNGTDIRNLAFYANQTVSAQPGVGQIETGFGVVPFPTRIRAKITVRVSNVWATYVTGSADASASAQVSEIGMGRNYTSTG